MRKPDHNFCQRAEKISHKKVLIAILLTTCLILSSVSFFASCVSRQNDDSGTTEGDTTEEDTTEEVTTAPVPEAKEAELMGDFVPSETYKGVVSEETFVSNSKRTSSKNTSWILLVIRWDSLPART